VVGAEGKVHTVVGKNLFKKETDMKLFVGMKVTTDAGEVGVIQGSFGGSGKFKVHFTDGTAAQPKGTGDLQLPLCAFARCLCPARVFLFLTTRCTSDDFAVRRQAHSQLSEDGVWRRKQDAPALS
jgi:hypothetical protein